MLKSRMTRRRLLEQSALAATALIAAPYVRGAHAAGKLSIGFWDHWVPGANNASQGAVRGMGREGEGRGLDRLHHLAGQQEPADHRRRGAGAVRPRHLRVPDLGAAGACAEPRAGRRHHGRADQAERRGQPDRRISRREPTASGSPCRPRVGSQIKGPCSRIDLMKKHAGIDVQAMYPAGSAPKADGLDARCHAQGRRGLPQGRPSVRHRPRHDRGQSSTPPARSSSRSAPTLVDAKGNITVKSDAGAPGARILREARAVPAARRAGLGQRLQQQVPDLRQGRADHEPAERLGGRQARRAAGRRAMLDPRHAVGPEGPLRAVPAVLLGHLELRQEQVGGQEPARAPLAAARRSRRWWRRARGYDLPVVREAAPTSRPGPRKARRRARSTTIPNPHNHQILSVAAAPAPPKIAHQIYTQAIHDQDGRAPSCRARRWRRRWPGPRASSKASCAPERAARARAARARRHGTAAASRSLHDGGRRMVDAALQAPSRAGSARAGAAALRRLHAAQVDDRVPDGAAADPADRAAGDLSGASIRCISRR